MFKLEDVGFSNLREEPYDNIWDKSNWIVTNQGIPAGTVTDKNTFIQLDCISLDDYFSNNYVGKNIGEIQALAEPAGFALRFENTSGDDMTESVASMDDTIQGEWIATKAHQYRSADKTAIVTIKNIAEVPEIIEQKSTETESPVQSTESSKSVSYSTNSKDTVKDGNTGIYSYKNKGGSYDIYYIIDFDEGYVYYFCDGNGDATCDRIKIDSGTLNDVVMITYHDGSDTWQEGLHFKWSRQPDHLIMEDHNHFEYDFYTTDLSKALKLRDSKTIYDY